MPHREGRLSAAARASVGQLSRALRFIRPRRRRIRRFALAGPSPMVEFLEAVPLLPVRVPLSQKKPNLKLPPLFFVFCFRAALRTPQDPWDESGPGPKRDPAPYSKKKNAFPRACPFGWQPSPSTVQCLGFPGKVMCGISLRPPSHASTEATSPDRKVNETQRKRPPFVFFFCNPNLLSSRWPANSRGFGACADPHFLWAPGWANFVKVRAPCPVIGSAVP